MPEIEITGVSGTAAGRSYNITSDDGTVPVYQSYGSEWLVGDGGGNEIVTVTFDAPVDPGAVVELDLYDPQEDFGLYIDGTFVNLNTAVASGDVSIVFPGDGSSIQADGRIDQINSFSHDGISITINVPFTSIGFEKTNESGTPNGIGVSFSIPCFCGGTRLAVPGPEKTKAVDDLKVGDLVLNDLGEAQTIRWIGTRKISAREMRSNPKLRPVRISEGALGGGLPYKDLLVSRQHRMLAKSILARRMFDHEEVLLPAHKLVDLPGIYIDDTVTEVTYFHVMFDTHQIIYAEGAPTESFLPGPNALDALDCPTREELFMLFPELENEQDLLNPIRFIPPGKRQRAFVDRLAKNNRTLLDL